MTKPSVDLKGATVDVTIRILKGNASEPGAAVIDRKFVRLLSLVRETGSVQEACDRLQCPSRSVQRMLKNFTDATGLKLMTYHGLQGTKLTPAAEQCITLYAAALQSVQRIVQERGLPSNASLEMYAISEDGRLKLETTQIKGHTRDPTD